MRQSRAGPSMTPPRGRRLDRRRAPNSAASSDERRGPRRSCCRGPYMCIFPALPDTWRGFFTGKFSPRHHEVETEAVLPGLLCSQVLVGSQFHRHIRSVSCTGGPRFPPSALPATPRAAPAPAPADWTDPSSTKDIHTPGYLAAPIAISSRPPRRQPRHRIAVLRRPIVT